MILGPYSLVLDLKVQVPGEPVVEKGLLDIARGCQLWGRESSGENELSLTLQIRTKLLLPLAGADVHLAALPCGKLLRWDGWLQQKEL